MTLGTAHGDGAKPGPSAMELVLIGAGGCSAWDVVNILEKSRAGMADCVVELDADRAPEEPRVFTRIHMHFVVSGPRPRPAQGGAGDRALGGEILLRHRHAGEDGHHHP